MLSPQLRPANKYVLVPHIDFNKMGTTSEVKMRPEESERTNKTAVLRLNGL
jgi:hypothetical protein